MMRLRSLFAGLTTLGVACAVLTGCSTGPPGTDLPVGKPLTQEELQVEKKKLMDGMKGQYMGAPGAPKPKTQ